jgi:hypothetical protein
MVSLYAHDLGTVTIFRLRIRVWIRERARPRIRIIGASLSEPHSLVAHRAQAQYMHYGAFVRSFVRSLYVRTRNFSYSDLNPTGFSPRTGYFENFQSNIQWFTVNFTGFSPADNFSCDMRWNIFFMPNNKWKLEWSVLFTVVSIYIYKPITILLYSSELRFKFWYKARFDLSFGLNIL